MKIVFACLADHAHVDALGKLSITGVFDIIGGQTFPLVHRSLFLCCRIKLEYEDSQRMGEVRIRLVDQDGHTRAELKGQVRSEQRVEPGRFVTHNLLLELQDIAFAQAGRFTFVIEAGTSTARVDLLVEEKPLA